MVCVCVCPGQQSNVWVGTLQEEATGILGQARLCHDWSNGVNELLVPAQQADHLEVHLLEPVSRAGQQEDTRQPLTTLLQLEKSAHPSEAK